METPPPEPSTDPTPFSPAPAVEFSPGEDGAELVDTPPPSPVDPGEEEPDRPASKPLFDMPGFAPGGFGPDEGPGLGFAANGRAAAGTFAAQDPGAEGFPSAEVHQNQPLWSTQANDVPDLARGGARDNGWLVVTAVLVAIFVAVTVGFAVLSEDGGTSRAAVEEAPLTRPEGGDGATPTTAPTPTEVVPTTVPVAPVAEWGVVVADDRSFRAEMPGAPTAVSANLAGTPAVSYSVDSGTNTFRVVTSSFTPESDAATDVALEAAAAAVVDGAAVTGGPVTAYPGGLRVYDFRATSGDRTVLGRAMAAAGHRYVLTMMVPSDATESPDVLTDLVRFRNGFLPNP